MRIWTPGGELPFAGHPTLGSAHAWLEAGGEPADPAHLVQECGAGLVAIRRDPAGLLSFAAPPTIRSGPIEEAELERLTRALGLRPEQVIAHQWVDNGPGWAVLRLATADEVLAVVPDLSAIPDAMVGVIGDRPAGSGTELEMRTFAPSVGIPEDPVCGSMNASVAQWLLREGVMSGAFRVSQGTALGRTGVITLTPDDDCEVWVGGSTNTLSCGTALA